VIKVCGICCEIRPAVFKSLPPSLLSESFSIRFFLSTPAIALHRLLVSRQSANHLPFSPLLPFFSLSFVTLSRVVHMLRIVSKPLSYFLCCSSAILVSLFDRKILSFRQHPFFYSPPPPHPWLYRLSFTHPLVMAILFFPPSHTPISGGVPLSSPTTRWRGGRSPSLLSIVPSIFVQVVTSLFIFLAEPFSGGVGEFLAVLRRYL